MRLNLGSVLSKLMFVFALWSLSNTALMAQSISLNGDWSFVADPSGTLQVAGLASAANVRPTRVPSSWQSQFADLRDYAGVAWYWRSVTVPTLEAGRVALLDFGAVDYRADVYVNGQKVGSHEGGYLPFQFDITPLLRSGENQIAVRVVDPGARPHEMVEGVNYAEIPHGKQNWYVQTSGLWQDVALDLRPRMHLGALHVSGGADGSFTIAAAVENPLSAPASGGPAFLGAEIRDARDKTVWKATENLSPGDSSVALRGKLENPNQWSPASPYLYTLHAWLSSGDSLETHFGFRTLATQGGKFYLNGKVIYLRGALDQDFYPETIYTPPSLDYLRDEMRQAKALGLNLLRCHIKVPDPRYLEAADEVGVLVWYEIPNWDRLTENSERRAAETLRGMIERDWNHPSIVIASIINESWGADLKQEPERAWLRDAYLRAKKVVPGWLVEDNSACCDNFHMATDVADFHQYNAIPGYAADFDRFVADLAHRPGWLFSPYADASPKGDEPLMLSEFGNWGLPHLPDPRPWWFSRDFGGNEMTLPDGVEKRFGDYQYATLFPDVNALAEATEWREFESLKYEIESIRQHPEIQGYVITEFTDINWESNGLLDMWRRPKVFGRDLSTLQQDDLVMASVEKHNWTSGEKAVAKVSFSHYAQDSLGPAEVRWSVEGTSLSGSFPLPPLPSGSAASAGKIEFTVPATNAPSEHRLKLEVVSAGKTLGENSLALYFYPPSSYDLRPAVSFHDPTGRLRRLVNEMRSRNYLAPSGAEALPVLIASGFDDTVKRALDAGGRVILILGDRQTLAPGLEIVPSAGSDLSGNWISSFLWVRREQDPFKSIGFRTLPGFETEAVSPSAMVQGIPAQNFKDVLSGIFYGWIHSNVGVLVQAKYGKGKLLIATFSLSTTYGSDPYATILLDHLIDYVISDFAPEFEIPGAAP